MVEYLSIPYGVYTIMLSSGPWNKYSTKRISQETVPLRSMGVEGRSQKTPDSCQTCQSQGCVCISLSLCLEGPVSALAVNWAAKVKQTFATEWTAHSQGCQIILCNGKTPGQAFSHSKNKMRRARFAPPLPQLMPTGSPLRSLLHDWTLS